MSKITKQDLQFQINRLYAADSTRHNKMLRMQRALSSLGVDIMSDEFDAPDSTPKLKQLDQSVFDGLDEKWRFAATDRNDKAFLFSRKPTANNTEWYAESIADYEIIGTGYDASNWQNSLIERESLACEESDFLNDTISNIFDEIIDIEYFYSKITCELLEKGSSYVLAYVSGKSEQTAIENKEVAVIESMDVLFKDTNDYDWKYAVSINQQTGEPLTAKEVGL